MRSVLSERVQNPSAIVSCVAERSSYHRWHSEVVEVRLGLQGCSKLLKGESPAVHTLNSPVTNFHSYLQEQGAHPESLLPRAQQ